MSYLTDEEKKMPKDVQRLQYVLGIQCCKTKEDVVDLIIDIEKQAKQEKAKEIKKDFQPIFEVLNIDKSPEIIKIWRKHCQKENLDKERVSKKGNSYHLEGELIMNKKENKDNICVICGKINDGHKHIWKEDL